MKPLFEALGRSRRVRSIVQNEASECGLACLAMVANAHRHDIDLSYLRALFPVGQKGMSLGDVVELADGLGLDANGYALGKVDELRNLALPAMLHWTGNHFVVLERIRGDRFHVHDPQFGLRIYDAADMARMFSGVALEFSARLDFQRLKAQRRLTLAELLRTTHGLGGVVWQIAVVSLAITLLSLATPILLQVAIDVIIPQVDIDLLHLVALGLILFMGFEAFGRWLRNFLTLRASTLLQMQFTRNVVGHAFRLPLGFFEQRHPGDFAVRIDSIDHVKNFLVGGLVTALADSITSVLLIALMYYYSPSMTLVTVGSLIAIVLLRLVTFPVIGQNTLASLEARSLEQAALLDGLRRVDTLKAHNGVEPFVMRWFGSFARFADSDFRAKKATMDAELLMQLAIAVSTVATLYMGVVGVIANTLTIGMLYAFFALRGVFFERVNLLTTNLMHLSVMRVHLQRLDDIVEHEPETHAGEMPMHRAIRRTVALEKVAVQFGHGEEPLLTGVDLSIDLARHETVAILGVSGSGKSSLLRIIASLREPAAGRLTVDGTGVGQFGKREYRSNLGVVFADDGLVAGTVADNLSLFDPGITRRDMEAALDTVGLREEIDQLPQGLATRIAEESGLLSTGQRRRLLLARALARKPALLLLDEITANLDPGTERALIESLKTVKAAKVFVTHSQRLLDGMNRVFRIEDRKLVRVTAPGGRAPALPFRGDPPRGAARDDA